MLCTQSFVNIGIIKGQSNADANISTMYLLFLKKTKKKFLNFSLVIFFSIKPSKVKSAFLKTQINPMVITAYNKGKIMIDIQPKNKTSAT